MTEHPDLLDQQFSLMRDSVTDAVQAHVRAGRAPDAALRERLRAYERAAWGANLEGQTLQVLASARRLLGDTIDLRPRPSPQAFASLAPAGHRAGAVAQHR